VTGEASPEARSLVPDLDAADVRRAAQGDLAAAGRLYRRHRARVLHLGRVLLRTDSDADDLCQETFLRAFSALAGFRQEVPFSAWLYRIALNQCRTFHARRKTRQRFIAGSLDGEPLPPPRGVQAGVDLQAALRQLVHLLSEGQREVLVCHDVLGMSHEEIGVTLGCAPGTSKAQLHKARAKLRELLAGERA